MIATDFFVRCTNMEIVVVTRGVFIEFDVSVGIITMFINQNSIKKLIKGSGLIFLVA